MLRNAKECWEKRAGFKGNQSVKEDAVLSIKRYHLGSQKHILTHLEFLWHPDSTVFNVTEMAVLIIKYLIFTVHRLVISNSFTICER